MSEQKPYNPCEHLVKIKSKGGTLKDYSPASYRLYELTLRSYNANFSSEMVHMDVERNLVVITCRLSLGAHPDQSEKKTEAMKSGLLCALDKVETAAKARCARDFGISTELALETEPSEVPPPRSKGVFMLHPQIQELDAFCSSCPDPNEVETLLRELGLELTFTMKAVVRRRMQTSLPAQYYFEGPDGTEILYLAGRDVGDEYNRLPSHQSRFWAIGGLIWRHTDGSQWHSQSDGRCIGRSHQCHILYRRAQEMG